MRIPTLKTSFCYQFAGLILGMMLTALPVSALQLEEPRGFVFGGKGLVGLTDGTVLDGEITGTPLAQNGLAGIIFHGEKKQRIKAPEIRRIKVRKGKADRLTLLKSGFPGGGLETNPTKSFKRLSKENNTDLKYRFFNKALGERDEYFRFDRMELPLGEVRLLQLLNVGFHSRIRVYRKPNALGVFDLEKQRYLVFKDDGEQIIVDKGKYAQVFGTLFDDCAALEGYRPKELKFRHFAEHLFVYDVFCGSE